jgi:hypothetical protein
MVDPLVRKGKSIVGNFEEIEKVSSDAEWEAIDENVKLGHCWTKHKIEHGMVDNQHRRRG